MELNLLKRIVLGVFITSLLISCKNTNSQNHLYQNVKEPFSFLETQTITEKVNNNNYSSKSCSNFMQ